MGMHSSRRTFLKTAAAGGALAGLGDLGFLAGLPRVSAADAKPDPKVVRLQPEIEPLVRLLEDTPREKLLEEVARRIQKGLSYREVLAALQLAGVRNVQPRPSVGYKFHAVLVVNSAHLASLSSPDEHRWLPIFWALDYFKSSQAQDVREGNWTMGPVEETAVPKATKARTAFITAMDNWDEAAADAAVAGLARSVGANEAFELFARYGARDFRSIGWASPRPIATAATSTMPARNSTAFCRDRRLKTPRRSVDGFELTTCWGRSNRNRSGMIEWSGHIKKP
ncbi:MAG: twin-arginine translocation signal domain-containing protein [Planctomycetes bacterium]|nr:twin-arginine translocation signal domain-containing protein [Planctomycetota bacterium]